MSRRTHHSAKGQFPDEFKENGAGMIFGGVALTAGCIGATWLLWEAGWVASATFLGILAGLGLILSGIEAAKREARARAEWPRVLAKKDEIVQTLLELKTGGGRPYDWLIENGYRHRGIRKHLMGAMRTQLKRAQQAEASDRSPRM